MWLTAHFEYAGLSSYRIPGHSSQYAAASPVPGPSAVKLGLTSVAIQQSRKISEGERVFEAIKTSGVVYGLPIQVAISSFLMKRLKKKKEEVNGERLEQTYGTRGYVHYDSPLVIGIEVPQEELESIRSLLFRLRYLGTSDSIVTCTCVAEGTPCRSVRASDHPIPQEHEAQYVVVPLKDFQPLASFDQVNRYGSASATRALRDVYYLFPVQRSEVIENGFRYVFDTRS